jgi:sodium/bile acid cotransporter 7
MIRRFAAVFEPFIVALFATVAIASVAPPRGIWAEVFAWAAQAGVVLLFFLHGTKLSREALWAGARNLKLHVATLATTFIAFPLLGVGVTTLPGLSPALGTGVLFLTLLPSTVQSSIAFTSIARGNVAAALCAASFSNLLGIVVTPALVALLLHLGHGDGVGWAAVRTILLQLLLPFVIGQLARPWIGSLVARHARLVGFVDRGSILLVVYTAFGAAVVNGLWRRLSGADLALLVALCCVLLTIVLGWTILLGRWLRLGRDERIVLLFCGSKKSLASGVPMAGVLFPAAQIGVVLLPIMIFHQTQLIACAIIARRLGEGAPDRTLDG